MNNNKYKIFIAGHNGMVGSAIKRNIQMMEFGDILTRSHDQLDLTNQTQVEEFFSDEKPDQVYLAAAKVGGISANSKYPADFIYKNIMIQANIINSAYTNGVKKLLFLGSSCIYPKFANQPISEDSLLTGFLESTNEPYAIAKIAGIKLCESFNRQYGVDYRSVMPTNLYGPGDNYHPENSHVIPGLIRRFHDAKINKIPKVSIWGSGRPRREFLHVDDLAKGCIHIMNIKKSIYNEFTEPMLSHINIGVGHDLTISELAQKIMKTVGYNGLIDFDDSKPDGTPQKLMDNSIITNLGWQPNIDLDAGLINTYDEFLKRY